MQRSILLSSDQVRSLEERARQIHPGLLQAIRATSRRMRTGVYLVGGTPRDLMLSRQLEDFDLVVEGDGLRFASELGAALGAEVRAHERFGTAELEGLGDRLDIATARRETYEAPAALPRVEFGSLVEDLERRDFTINTLVVELGCDSPSSVRDAYGAMVDITERRLRILHERSFLDDPTRILRGIRFEQRLGFRMDQEAETLSRAAVREGAFEPLSGDRLRRELFRLLEPTDSMVPGLLRLEELGLLSVLDPHLALATVDLDWISRSTIAVRELPADLQGIEGWRLALPMLLGSLGMAEREAVADRLAVAPEDRGWILDVVQDLDRVLGALGRATTKPHEVDRCLRSLRVESIVHLLACEESAVVEWTRRWLSELRRVELTLTGEVLVRSGIPPGPEIGQALARTHEARVDGILRAEDELTFALEFVERQKRGSTKL